MYFWVGENIKGTCLCAQLILETPPWILWLWYNFFVYVAFSTGAGICKNDDNDKKIKKLRDWLENYSAP